MPSNPLGDPQQLASIVDRVWHVEIDGASGTEHRLPNGQSQLVFGLDPDHPVALLQGPTTRPTTIERAPQRLAVGVCLRPGALRTLTGEPADAFADRIVELDQVWSEDAVGLIEELRAAHAADRVDEVLARVMMAAANRHRGRDRVAPAGSVHRGLGLLRRGVGVAEVCDHLGVSRSSFVSSFRSEVGTTPKMFARVARFTAAVAAVRAPDTASLSTIAAGLGYADQSHMTRDFVEFAGRTPGSLHGDGSPSPNHVRQDVADQ